MGYWDWFTYVVTGCEIALNDGRTIYIEGVRASQLKGYAISGGYEWSL